MLRLGPRSWAEGDAPARSTAGPGPSRDTDPGSAGAEASAGSVRVRGDPRSCSAELGEAGGGVPAGLFPSKPGGGVWLPPGAGARRLGKRAGPGAGRRGSTGNVPRHLWDRKRGGSDMQNYVLERLSLGGLHSRSLFPRRKLGCTGLAVAVTGRFSSATTYCFPLPRCAARLPTASPAQSRAFINRSCDSNPQITRRALKFDILQPAVVRRSLWSEKVDMGLVYLRSGPRQRSHAPASHRSGKGPPRRGAGAGDGPAVAGNPAAPAPHPAGRSPPAPFPAPLCRALRDPPNPLAR